VVEGRSSRFWPANTASAEGLGGLAERWTPTGRRPTRLMSRHPRTRDAGGDGCAAGACPAAGPDHRSGRSSARPASPSRPVRPGRAAHPRSARDDVLLHERRQGVGMCGGHEVSPPPTAPRRSGLLPAPAAVTRIGSETVNVVVLASLARVPVSGELHSTRGRGKAPPSRCVVDAHDAGRARRVTQLAFDKSGSLR
jgi:hypothetical protein